ncbi:MAG: glycine C-acetyltransferase [Rhodothermales bacterium]|nr:glycine C-acetyltransferase [Rhodothermales bacterium]MBO6780072.1 glycine C-acetyltransferase [Rhodothermales bacterium]
MFDTAADQIRAILDDIRESGLYKEERVITSDQAAEIEVSGGQEVINFCANNYLGLSNHPELIKAAQRGLEHYGFGLSSVRFICGTQTIHKELEARVAEFLGTEDTILYAACFDANGGLFETLLDKECAVISDQLNHASIIDGVRLSKAARYRYNNGDMNHLEQCLKEASGAKRTLITTDGVFSMDGSIAKLDEICDLADRYGAMVHFDDCHATGFFGPTGRGTHEYCGVMDRVDIITSTLGKALGGAMGGFTSGRKEVIELLRQRSRPYLFSNSLAPSITYTSIKVLDMLSETTALRDRLESNTTRFRESMTSAGFDIKPGVHPIVPIMLYDARLAQNMAADLLDEGIYVIGFSYPVVPKGQARIRVQISAAHTEAHLDRAVDAFTRIGRKHGVVS